MLTEYHTRSRAEGGVYVEESKTIRMLGIRIRIILVKFFVIDYKNLQPTELMNNFLKNINQQFQDSKLKHPVQNTLFL